MATHRHNPITNEHTRSDRYFCPGMAYCSYAKQPTSRLGTMDYFLEMSELKQRPRLGRVGRWDCRSATTPGQNGCDNVTDDRPLKQLLSHAVLS